jgi:hypothetical protein
MTPFEAVYGRPPPTVHCYESQSTTVAQVEEGLRNRDALLKHLRENLQVA